MLFLHLLMKMVHEVSKTYTPRNLWLIYSEQLIQSKKTVYFHQTTKIYIETKVFQPSYVHHFAIIEIGIGCHGHQQLCIKIICCFFPLTPKTLFWCLSAILEQKNVFWNEGYVSWSNLLIILSLHLYVVIFHILNMCC